MKTAGRLPTLVALALVLASIGGNGEHRRPGAEQQSALAAPPAALRFRRDGVCPVPIVGPGVAFKGGATTGEQVTVRIDTSRHTYDVRIDASRTPGRQGMRRRGTLSLDRQDCSYRMSGEAGARLAVNKDGVLFGGLDAGADEADAPVLIVAFKNTSADLVDLSGNWWVFESRPGNGERAASAYEAKILPDGRFSQCELKGDGDGECVPRVGRIYYNGTVFVSQEENGDTGTLVVGRVADKLVPILLLQGAAGSGMRILAAHHR